ncbi:hypothetical protein RUM43_013042 [Polyplax serrata]|uniref:Rab-GAP TBC domain-containing protein n=1 Tax=Polyplax serrata TaxID=468196 RepID=A0AAN8RSJ9_POLSC
MPEKLSFMSEKCALSDLYQTGDEIVVNPETVDDVDNENMNEPEFKNAWFKTWLDNDYNKLNQTPGESSLEDDTSSVSQMKNVNSPIPLNKLLDNIPLAYSPITKQLHVITSRQQQKNSVSKVYQPLGKTTVNEEYDCHQEESTKIPQKNENGKNSNVDACHVNDTSEENEEKLCKLWNNKIRYSEAETSKDDLPKTKADTCSFSSMVSSLSGSSPLNQDDSTSSKFSMVDNDDLSLRSLCSHDSGSTCGENSKFFEETNIGKDGKRNVLSEFFSRNVFAWKPTNSISSQGWKIFGKNSSQENSLGSLGNEVHASRANSPLTTKKYEDVIVSSSALILHNRPANLPAKSEDEQQKHKLEYEQIVEAARKKEVKESKKRKKQLQQQLKFEEQLTSASKIWSCEIIPKWDVMKNSRKTRDLWWAGIPPSMRGKIWKLAIGNELNITYQLYEICAARAQERLKNLDSNSAADLGSDANKESSVELIQLDISRTFPQLCIFQKGGPYYDILHCLLGAYVCYRPDVGYVQGMSFIAAVLILNLEPADAFICFANLLNRPCHLAFFTLNQPFMHAYYNTYNGFFKENLPKLCQHFQETALTPDLYLLDWVYSVFAKAMHLDIACRIWDVFLRDGEEFIFRAALGILHLYQDKLLRLDFINGAQFLRKLPDDLSADLLFKSIDSIKMSIGKVKFRQILTKYTERYSSR